MALSLSLLSPSVILMLSLLPAPALCHIRGAGGRGRGGPGIITGCRFRLSKNALQPTSATRTNNDDDENRDDNSGGGGSDAEHNVDHRRQSRNTTRMATSISVRIRKLS